MCLDIEGQRDCWTKGTEVVDLALSYIHLFEEINCETFTTANLLNMLGM